MDKELHQGTEEKTLDLDIQYARNAGKYKIATALIGTTPVRVGQEIKLTNKGKVFAGRVISKIGKQVKIRFE